MDAIIIEGEVIHIGEVYATETFKKKEIAVDTGGDYPQKIGIEFVNDKEELLDVISIGQKVKVTVNLRGREWVNPEGVSKFFNSLSAWKIEVVS